MTNAYILADGGKTRPMERVHCKNEDNELQRILALNPDLLPGDQISPEDSRRWLLIDREMPVPDPTSGDNRWSIDVLFVDQSAIPTFIECKRFEDTRARREVIGQMIEYAANGQYYWEEAELADRASKNAERNGNTLDDAVRSLGPDDDVSTGEFFERVQLNLREGQLRLVFFLEKAPMELKSIVDFLNRQMERSEVLLVEAQQFRHDSMTIIYPRLFGYTEEARRVKKTRRVTTGTKRKWDLQSFQQAVAENVSADDAAKVRQLYDFLADLAPDHKWGAAINGSVNFYWPDVCNAAVFSMFGNGYFQPAYGAMKGNPVIEQFRDALKIALEENLGFTVKEQFERRYPDYKVAFWGERLEALKQTIESVVNEHLTNPAE